MNDIVLSVSDFIAVVNQTLEYAYSSVIVVGELASFKISKNKWIYFDLKDEFAKVRFFGTIYTLPGPLEDGMLLEVRGSPRLHPQFGLSITVQAIRPVGRGSIKRASDLLETKLRAEGLFDEGRKRLLPYPPQVVGLITSKESAAYADFMKILRSRWRGLDLELIDVQVQGDAALLQIVSAIEDFNQSAVPPDVLVLVRGGGSADDLQVFSTEQVTRAVASSRIPTLVAIGHELDVSLAELAADQRASTPSNAAELLVPDRKEVLKRFAEQRSVLRTTVESLLKVKSDLRISTKDLFNSVVLDILERNKQYCERQRQLVIALNPETTLKRGYAIIRDYNGNVVRNGKTLAVNDIVNVQLLNDSLSVQIRQINMKD